MVQMLWLQAHETNQINKIAFPNVECSVFYPPFQFQLLSCRIACILCNAILHSALTVLYCIVFHCVSVFDIVVICFHALVCEWRAAFLRRLLLLPFWFYGVCHIFFLFSRFPRWYCWYSLIFVIYKHKLPTQFREYLLFWWMFKRAAGRNEHRNWWNQMKIKTLHGDGETLWILCSIGNICIGM